MGRLPVLRRECDAADPDREGAGGLIGFALGDDLGLAGGTARFAAIARRAMDDVADRGTGRFDG